MSRITLPKSTVKIIEHLMLQVVDLARISHQVYAATLNMPASTALRSVGLLNIVSTMPTSSSRRVPCIHRHLQRFATIPGEKCRLGLFYALTAVFNIWYITRHYYG